MRRRLSIFGALPNFLLILALIRPITAQAPQPGQISALIVDAQTGDPLIGVVVLLKDTQHGTTTDMDGNFYLRDVSPATYELVASMIGYNQTTITGVQVQSGTTTRLELTMELEVIQLEKEVVIEAKALRNTEAALLKERQKAPAVSDAISAEDISRAGSSDAADAMKHVTGASVEEGKYVVIRGLGNRYSTVQLNGAALPSSDPNKKTAAIDLFPSSLLDNIVTVKSFTPDKPGNFTGGSVNIGTKSFPGSFTFSLSSSTSYNPQTTFEDNFLTYNGGKWDWLGFDDGTRQLPELLNQAEIPDIGEAWSDAEKARQLDRLSKSFSPVMNPSTEKAPLNHSYSFAVGNQMDLLDRPLGFLGTFTYSRKFSAYDQGRSGRWQLTGKVEDTSTLNNNFLLDDARSAEEVLWGGLLNLSYKLHPNHGLSLTCMLTRNSEDIARFLSGPFPRDLELEATYETRVLQFTQRGLQSLQLSGEHLLKPLRDLRVEWSGSTSTSAQDEPDLRFFSNNFTIRERNGKVDTLYSVTPSRYPEPARYFRNLDETSREFQLDLSLPFKQWHGLNSIFKIGGLALDTERRFRERRYDLVLDSKDVKYTGDADEFFSTNVGLVDTSGTLYRFGNYIEEATQLSSNFDGDQQIYATYAMVDLPLTLDLRAIAGARLEATRIKVESLDATKPVGNLSENDVLPSLNLVYQLQNNMNLRASYGRTLARPTFRELAPYSSFDFVGSFIFIGNENLERTLVDNYDLRWEYFGRPGEIYALSFFHKDFHNPIERALLTINGQVQFQNVEEARVTGLELELRRSLQDLSAVLEHFHAGTNLSLVHSKVSIPDRELEIRRTIDPQTSSERALQGQSPFLLNLDLIYDNFNTGTSAGLYYNLFGRRLSEVSLGGTPNVFEEPRGALDFTFSWKFNHAYRFKIGAKNLLDPKNRKVYPYQGADYVAREYERGRTFSFGLTYNIER